MANRCVQITLSQRASSSTVTVVVTVTETHAQQEVSKYVRKFGAQRDALSADQLDRQLGCYVQRALEDMEAELPF